MAGRKGGKDERAVRIVSGKEPGAGEERSGLRGEDPMNQERNFSQWFQQATGNEPYPYQTRFACEPSLFRKPSPLVGEGRVRGPRAMWSFWRMLPTGQGKTAMAV